MRRTVIAAAVLAVIASAFVLLVRYGGSDEPSDETPTTSTGSTDGLPTTTTGPEVPASSSTTAAPPSSSSTIQPGATALRFDGLFDVDFGADGEVAIGAATAGSGGSVLDDRTAVAQDEGIPSYNSCPGPNGEPTTSRRIVSIVSGSITIDLYIANAVFLGYAVSGEGPGYELPEGVGIGSTEAELVHAFGDRIHVGTGSSRVATLTPQPGEATATTFEYVAGETVTRLQVGGRCAD